MDEYLEYEIVMEEELEDEAIDKQQNDSTGHPVLFNASTDTYKKNTKRQHDAGTGCFVWMVLALAYVFYIVIKLIT